MNPTTAISRVAAGLVALVAGFASYRHIYDVATSSGEHRSVSAVLPLAIDGLILVATLAMLDDKRQNRRPRLSARLALLFGVVATLAANVASANPDIKARLVAAVPAVSFLLAVEVLARKGKLLDVDEAPDRADVEAVKASGPVGDEPPPVAAADPAPVAVPVAVGPRFDHSAPIGPDRPPAVKPVRLPRLPDPVGADTHGPGCSCPLCGRIRDALAKRADGPAEPVAEPTAATGRRRVTARSLTVADRVAAAHHREPDATHERIAELAGCGVTTVKKYRPRPVATGQPSGPDAGETATEPAPVGEVNGHRPALVDALI